MYLEKEDFSIAEQYFSKAIFACNYQNTGFEKINSFKYLIDALLGITLSEIRIYKKTREYKFLNKAIFYSNLNLDAINYEENQFLFRNSKNFWQSRNHEVYEKAINLHLFHAIEKSKSTPKETFSFAEKSKATILQSQIKETDALHYANIPDSLLKKEYDLRIDITYNEKRRQDKMNEGLSETDTLVLRISSRLFDLNQEYEVLKQKFETDYPEYYKLKYDLSTVSLEEVQNKLLEKDQTLLEYFVGDSSIYLFVVKPDDYIVEEVKMDFDLESLVATLQSGLYDYYKTPASDRTDELYEQSVTQYAKVAHQLYEKLIEPVKDKLNENLVIIPDGILGYVPFEALLSGAPSELNNIKTYPFLVRDHQVSYNYSATLWREMKEKKHFKNPEKSLLAFAPFYEGSYTYLDEEFQDFDFDSLAIALDLTIEDEYVSRKDFTALPASGEEVSTISKLLKGAYFVNADATEERFNQEAGNYKIIHLSTHGVADSRVGDYSYLAFAEILDSIENELLYVRDLYNIQLNADLVVLSACETGVGKLQKGEGIISLARAFAYAGAKSIVTTLWTVNDSTTKNLMQAFYSGLKKGQTKDKALQNAKLALMKKGDEKAHPFFWAGFIPVGDMTPIK
ncbi:MAG: CHAT domain-containing protein [Saprospiraceae bacterium]